MIVLDPQYRILAANTAYQRQFGTAGKPYVGHKCYRVSHHYDVPCDQAGEHCPMKRAFELKGPDRVLHIHHTPRGPEHADVELRPILDGEKALDPDAATDIAEMRDPEELQQFLIGMID